MRFELIVLLVTGFLLYNTYHGGKYTKVIFSYKKYFQMAVIAFLAISFYLMIKKNPAQSKNMLLYANNMVKYMPIDKSSMDLISPIFDFTSSKKGFMEELNTGLNPNFDFNSPADYQEASFFEKQKRIGNTVATKRSVSGTKKKYIAYNQDWKCGHCGDKLKHTFEVDHKIRLEYGGTNDDSNLVALCRECHGIKTAKENM